MIKGMHGMFRSSRAQELRAFIRDKLKLPATDVGGGWLIFDLAEADIGVHPTDPGEDGRSGEHDISFYTDDVEGTVAELKGRGVRFDQAIEDHGYGLVTYFTMPGFVKVQLYQPKYTKRTRTRGAAKPKAKAKPQARVRAVPKKIAKTKKKKKKAARRRPTRARAAKRSR